MGNLLTLTGREIRGLVVSPVLWVVLVMFLLFNGVSFWELLAFLSQPMAPEGAPMQFFFGKWMIYWLAMLTMCSVIPMGTIAAEVRQGTIETLMTAPVMEWQVVLAKFFASWIFFAILWAPTLVYVGILMQYGDPDFGPIVGGYLGTLLLGGCFLSVGVLMSAMTGNQMVAAVLSFGCYGCLFLLSLLAYLPSQGASMDVVNYMNLWEHMDNWGRGVVDTRHVVYYVTVIVLALFYAVRVLESRRWR